MGKKGVEGGEGSGLGWGVGSAGGGKGGFFMSFNQRKKENFC